MNIKDRLLDSLTTRQYGEVVLPDAASGQGPGTLASKLSRCKEGMAHFLPSWYKFYCVQMRVSGCNSHYKFVLSAGAKAKSVTNNLPILSVLGVRSTLHYSKNHIILEQSEHI